MKEKVYKIISYAIAIILVFCTLWSCGKVVNAAVPENQKVVSHNATWEGYPFTFTLGGKYYTINDPQGIPTSTYQNPNFFYTHDNVKFDFISGIDIYTYILNKNLGIVLKDTVLTTIYNSFTTLINVLDSNDEYLQGGLYDGSGNFLGYCLNDISGCYFAQNSTDGLDYNQDLPNDIYNHYKYFQDNNYEAPPFFSFTPISNNGVISNVGTRVNWTTEQIEYFNQNSSHNCWGVFIDSNQNWSLAKYRNESNCYVEIPDDCYYVASSPTEYDKLCKVVGLSTENTNLTYTKLVSTYGNSSYFFTFVPYAVNGATQVTTVTQHNVYSKTDTTLNSYGNYYFGMTSQIYISNMGLYMPFGGGTFTFYRNSTSKYQIDTQTYYPNGYITDSFNNYDSNNTNSYNTTKSVVDNSVQNNGDAYTDCNNDFYNYYNNGYYDSSSQITNNTTIINNYYPDNGGGGGDNPDNPNNPNDNSTLDEILRAILRFFNAIGDIIGTLLASIINLIDSVLEALAGVMESLTGASDLFASLFAWIPEPVPHILGAGFGICLVCGIIKFIRG